MMVSPQMFGRMTRKMMEIAPEGQLVLALEGGYNVDITAECAVECVTALLSPPGTSDPNQGPTSPSAWEAGALEHTERDLQKVKEIQREFWPL
mmetsp:Transcript_35220/g.55033  ORF Transcript_35220/g.55033 Transcript_35220/m.55033 type:complete len:93 (+) Transcript_35220:2-280(+)